MEARWTQMEGIGEDGRRDEQLNCRLCSEVGAVACGGGAKLFQRAASFGGKPITR